VLGAWSQGIQVFDPASATTESFTPVNGSCDGLLVVDDIVLALVEKEAADSGNAEKASAIASFRWDAATRTLEPIREDPLPLSLMGITR
jgi:hypothetical protein